MKASRDYEGWILMTYVFMLLGMIAVYGSVYIGWGAEIASSVSAHMFTIFMLVSLIILCTFSHMI